MKTATRIVGSGEDRSENDFYPTPAWTTEALLQREKFIGEIWEPACGDGAISKLLEPHYNVISSDLIDRGYGDVLDFLTAERLTDNIITNPPFSLCSKFIEKAKASSWGKIAMFLKTTALEGNGRYKMWIDTDYPLPTGPYVSIFTTGKLW